MHTLEDLQRIIATEADKFCSENQNHNIYQPINYLMKLGGKRLRPALTLMSTQLFSDRIEDCISPALAIEVFHNFTLMHDDIMDKAPLRRGMATVHEKWNTNVAILSGDAMMILAYKLLINTKAELLPEILAVFNKTALEVCVGQQQDMDFEIRNDVSLEEYLEMIRLKTSVLVGGAMKVGSIIAGADKESQQLVYNFGEHIGMAFQLRDDYLDAFGDEAKTGKQKGGDILADKKTFLQIRAEQLSGPEQRKMIDQYKGSRNSPIEKVETMLGLFEDLGVKEEIESKINFYYEVATDCLDQLKVDENRKSELRQFADLIMVRDH